MDNLHIDQHISQQFNEDLEKLRTSLLEMGGLVERQITDAVKAIENADAALAEEVMDREDKVDKYEVKLDKNCILVLARRQPAASDLRLVMTVTKVIRDLERMGDEANKIAKMAIALNEQDNIQRGYHEIRHIGANVINIVNVALDAFARFDVQAAIKVVRDDKDIDREYTSSIREMITFMMEDPRSITHVMNIMWALRALERIGDHARNIAEHVIYLVHGTDVRHSSPKEIEKKLADKM